MEKGNESGLTNSYKSGWQVWFNTFKANLKQGSHSGGQILDKFGAGGGNLEDKFETKLEQGDKSGAGWQLGKSFEEVSKTLKTGAIWSPPPCCNMCAIDNFGVTVVNICRTIVLKMCIAHNHFVDVLLYRATLSASFTPTQILVLLSLSVQLVIHS